MAFNKSPLKTALEASMTSLPASAGAAAQDWADAYGTYAAGGASCQGASAAGISAAKAVLKTALEAAFQTGSAASAAAGMATGFTAFWMVPPQTFAGVTPGLVTAVAGTATLQAGLAAAFASNTAGNASAADAAQTYSDLLDAFSKTVLVTHSPPSPCAAPLA